MKTMRRPGYHRNGFVATHALGYMTYGYVKHHVLKCMSCHKIIVVITGRAHYFHDNIYIYIYIYIYIHIYLNRKLSFYIFKNFIYVFIYIRISTISYTLIVVNISFFHRLMSFKVQFCFNLSGTSRKEDRTQQEKKCFTDRKTFQAIVCK